MYNRSFTPDQISELRDNEIFVFGSNLAGRHYGGAARYAYARFGAIMGQGVGLQGKSYAIPTMQGGVDTIQPYVDEFIDYAREHSDLVFLVTRIGCGIAGFKDEEIAPLFKSAINVKNIILPKLFVEFFDRIEEEREKRLRDKIRGSLIGGAVGDALGYPVEFMTFKHIQQKYRSIGRKDGITHYEIGKNGKALISDDTQMTLFTANGMLFGITRWATCGGLSGLDSYVKDAYNEWYETQTSVNDYHELHICWIRDILELNNRRAPGNTCMDALWNQKIGKQVDNDSKGCGGVMRVAPVAMLAAAHCRRFPDSESFWTEKNVASLSSDFAAMTHKHPLGYLSAAFHAVLVYKILLCDQKIDVAFFEKMCRETQDTMLEIFDNPNDQRALSEMWQLIVKALQLVDLRFEAPDAIAMIGEGWTGDEALAIAIYCSKKNLESFENAIIDAVNHDGDSDSTGSICGNIIGAILGYDAIPDYYKRDLELLDLMLEIADDLHSSCPVSSYSANESDVQQIWWDRYVNVKPIKRRSTDSTGKVSEEMFQLTPLAAAKLRYDQLCVQFHSCTSYTDRYRLAFEIALSVYDTENFKPKEVLYYNEFPIPFKPSLEEYLPVFIGDFYSRREMKIRRLCFRGEVVLGVRYDGSDGSYKDFVSGLDRHVDAELDDIYGKYGWVFFKFDRLTPCVESEIHFFMDLEGEFSFEVAMLSEDKHLHRLWYMYY